MAKAQQMQRLGDLTLKDCEDPDDFSLKIASLELEFNNLLSKEDKIATLIGVAGAKYAAKICGEQKLIKSRGDEITFRALVEAMCDVWQLLSKNSKAGKNNDKTALGLVQPGTFAET